jgi:tetratricopeptide (TPR) repeat protein
MASDCSLADERVRLLTNDGVSLLTQGRYDEGRDVFSKVLEVDPTFAEAFTKRASAHFMAGRYQDSLDDIAQALKLVPKHFGALTGKALCMYHLRHYQEVGRRLGSC